MGQATQADATTASNSTLSGELIAAIGQQATSTVFEACKQSRPMQNDVRPIAPGMRLCGRALTVRCHPADNLTLHAAVAIARPGDVIVADVGNFTEAGHWGEILTVAAMSRGVVGLVINGSVRDIAAAEKRGFPVFARAISMKSTVKQVFGSLNQPIICGGVTVNAGDLVLADEDGVVIVPPAAVEDALQASIARETKEAGVMEQLQAGGLTLDLLGFGKALTDQGIRIEDFANVQ